MVSLKKNPHECFGWLEMIVCDHDEIFHDVAEGVEQLMDCGGGDGDDGRDVIGMCLQLVGKCCHWCLKRRCRRRKS